MRLNELLYRNTISPNISNMPLYIHVRLNMLAQQKTNIRISSSVREMQLHITIACTLHARNKRLHTGWHNARCPFEHRPEPDTPRSIMHVVYLLSTFNEHFNTIHACAVAGGAIEQITKPQHVMDH